MDCQLPVAADDAPLVAIVGPTGCGKSEIGVKLAETFPAEIISCDSVQVYRYLDIGTAKLPLAERRGVPHHLIDIADPDEIFTAGDYARRARPLLREIVASRRVPIVAGGTGFYLRALLDGLFPGPGRDDALRTRLADREARKPGSLHRILSRLDAPSAARIHPNDVNKLIRALEVRLLTRQPLSELLVRGRDRLQGFRPLKIGLNPPREELYARLDARGREIFDSGLLEEVKHVLSLGFSPECKSLESLGYNQALRVLRGEMTVEEAIAEMQRLTRRYAKRQWTWFRREPDMEWFPGFGDEAKTQLAVTERVRAYLGGFAGFS
jgi:tRNA dimethylallyltransferase